MKSENILKAINDIDPELVADAEITHKRSAKHIAFRWGAVAACLLLIAGLVWEALAPPKIPVYENAMYTAEEIGNMLDREILGNGTSSYKEFFVPDSEYLYINSIPDSEYLTVYKHNKKGIAPNEKEFTYFLDSRLPKISQTLGIDLTEYTIRENEMFDGRKNLVGDIIKIQDASKYYISCIQYPDSYNLRLMGHGDENPTGEVFLNGERLEIDQTQSDNQILESLEGTKEKLFSMFNVSFSDVKLIRNYGEYSRHGVDSITIYFYNMADHPLNAIMEDPLSDHIKLYFDNIQNYSGDIQSDTILQKVEISYQQFRFDPKKAYAPMAQAKTISLEDAEILLSNGYVFGGHSCRLCMAAQEKVDFSDYDFVSIEYYTRNPYYVGMDAHNRPIIPFYAFYKKIGVAENGNEIYARTYVPAIEVSGYEEYFKSQEAKHPAQ